LEGMVVLVSSDVPFINWTTKQCQRGILLLPVQSRFSDVKAVNCVTMTDYLVVFAMGDGGSQHGNGLVPIYFGSYTKILLNKVLILFL
jgi:hypothetical protein